MMPRSAAVNCPGVCSIELFAISQSLTLGPSGPHQLEPALQTAVFSVKLLLSIPVV